MIHKTAIFHGGLAGGEVRLIEIDEFQMVSSVSGYSALGRALYLSYTEIKGCQCGDPAPLHFRAIGEEGETHYYRFIAHPLFGTGEEDDALVSAQVKWIKAYVPVLNIYDLLRINKMMNIVSGPGREIVFLVCSGATCGDIASEFNCSELRAVTWIIAGFQRIRREHSIHWLSKVLPTEGIFKRRQYDDTRLWHMKYEIFRPATAADRFPHRTIETDIKASV